MRPVASFSNPSVGKGGAKGKGKGFGGRGPPSAMTHFSSPSPRAETYGQVVSRPPTPPPPPQKVVAPLNPLNGPVALSSKITTASLNPKPSTQPNNQWQVAKGKGIKGGKGFKGGKSESRPGVCYTCHLQGRDWQHNFWECEHHKKFMGWKVQIQKGVVV